MLDTAEIRNIAGLISGPAMLAVMAMLCIRFIEAYMAVCVWLCVVSARPLFNCVYARNRALNHPVHLWKFALFPGGTRQGLDHMRKTGL
jgi:hypothetical protein